MTAVSDPPRVEFDLASLVREHQADVWRYLRYLGAAAEDADDLTQETFLAVARTPFELRSRGETAAYLRTAARNQLLMLRRKQGRQMSTVELAAAEEVWAAATPAGDSTSFSTRWPRAARRSPGGRARRSIGFTATARAARRLPRSLSMTRRRREVAAAADAGEPARLRRAAAAAASKQATSSRELTARRSSASGVTAAAPASC